MSQARDWLPGLGDPIDQDDVIDACLSPAIASDLTLQAVSRYGVDAAVLFTDTVVPLLLAGVDLAIAPGSGPIGADPIRRASDVLRLRPLDPDRLGPIRDAVGIAVGELGETPLIGIAAAPYTLASYLVEGSGSRDQLATRTMMYSDPHAWAGLLNWCADVTGEFLRAQVEAGASAVQLVDARAGGLSRRDYFKRVVPHTQRALSHLRGTTVPIIHSGLGTADFLDLMAGAGADAVGVDWRIALDEAARRVGPEVTLQGNIDPALLGVAWRTLRSHVDDVMERGRAARAHVVGLGDDLPPGTDPEVLARIVRVVHGDEPLD